MGAIDVCVQFFVELLSDSKLPSEIDLISKENQRKVGLLLLKEAENFSHPIAVPMNFGALNPGDDSKKQPRKRISNNCNVSGGTRAWIS